MKLKNFFLCSSTSGGRSRKVEKELEKKYGALRPRSPPRFYSDRGPPPETNDLGNDYYSSSSSSNPPKKHLTPSYSSYSCGSASSSKSSGSSSGIGSYSSNSLSKSKRALDSRSGRSRSERQKARSGSGQCCANGNIDQEFRHKFTLADYDVNPHAAHHEDLGVKVGDRIVWLREPPVHSNESGCVKWIGVIEDEEIAGIEFDRPLGLGSGWYKNRQLFTCEPQCGGLVAVAGLILEEDYLFNPEICPGTVTKSSPALNNCTDHNQRRLPLPHLNGSASSGISGCSPSPSPSSSSSNSLEIGQSSIGPDYQRNRDSSEKYLPSSKRSPPLGEFEVEHLKHSWSQAPQPHISFASPSFASSPVPRTVTVNNNGNSNNNQNNMPIPHIVAPIKEEDVERINGRQKGIQGHRNSCYLDATLFSMFSFSSVFDSILLQDYRHHPNRRDEEDENLARNVQRILRDEVVNPLRKDLYCGASNVMKLRQTMEHLDAKLTSEEMDPQEFLQLLFDKVLNLDEFMSLSSGQSDFFHQVLAQQSEQDRNRIPSIQQLFEQSLMLQDLKLKGVPQPALILQMPRSGNKYKMYEGILPNLTIDITDLVEDIPRMCIICGSLATYECSQCYGKFNSGGEARDPSSSPSPAGSGAESTAFCETCIQQIHKRKERQSHMSSVIPIKYSFPAHQYFPNALGSPTTPSSYFFGQQQQAVGNGNNWGNPSFNRNPSSLISSIPPPSNNLSLSSGTRTIPRVTLDLFAVICIETSHFVSFVKCGPDRKAPWVFFDSMADRVENINGTGHNVPQVRLLPKMGIWLDDLEKERDLKKFLDDDRLPAELKRLLADPYICLYYSKESSMYC